MILLLMYIFLLQPSADYEVATQLAYELLDQREEGDDVRLAVAIAMQESSLLGREGSIVDYGLFNLHLSTLIDYNINQEHLKGTKCIKCQVEAYYVIMRDKIKKCSKYKEEAWSCFHSATPHLREKYVRDVTGHMEKLKGINNEHQD